MKHLFKLTVFLLLATQAFGQGTLVWDFETGGRVYASPVVDQETLYIGSNDSCLYALDKQTGDLKWAFRTKGQLKSRPLLYLETVIFNSTDGWIYSVDKKTSNVRWKFETKGENVLDMWDYDLSSPVLSDGRVFVGSGDSCIYALDANNGRLVWTYRTEGMVHATPTVQNNRVFVGSFDGCFYALHAANGRLIWKFQTVGDAYFPKGEIQKGAVIENNAVLFGSRDFNLYALNLETGRGLWNMKEKGSWIVATPLVVGERVYVGTSDSHRFFGLNVQTGHEECSYALNMRVYGDAIALGKDVYFGCFNGKLYRLDTTTGNLSELFQTYGSQKNYSEVYDANGAFKAGFELYGDDLVGSETKILNLGGILSTPAIDGGMIYFGDSNGMVYGYRLE